MPETRQDAQRQDAYKHELTGPTYSELGHRDTVGWHYHDVSQLVYPSSGVLSISAAGGTWVVPPQRAVWIPAGVPHAHRAHGRVQLRTLAFPPSQASQASQEEQEEGKETPAVVSVSPLLREVIVALTTDDENNGRDARQRANLQHVALDELRRVDQLPVRLPALNDDRLTAIADILHGNPADERTLAEFGSVVGASERTLSRLFREEAGMSFPQWRTQFRLLRALLLLADGTPVTTTALDCGWSNPSAFIDTFRRAFGATPGRFYTPLRIIPNGELSFSGHTAKDQRPLTPEKESSLVLNEPTTESPAATPRRQARR